MTGPLTHTKMYFKWAWRIWAIIKFQGTRSTPVLLCTRDLGMCVSWKTKLTSPLLHAPFPATSPEWRNMRLQHFLGGVDFLLQSSSPSLAQRNLLSLYFLTHVSDVQGCDCKQCHRLCQSCLLLPCSLPSTPGVPVTGRKANKAKQ